MLSLLLSSSSLSSSSPYKHRRDKRRPRVKLCGWQAIGVGPSVDPGALLFSPFVCCFVISSSHAADLLHQPKSLPRAKQCSCFLQSPQKSATRNDTPQTTRIIGASCARLMIALCLKERSRPTLSQHNTRSFAVCP